MTSAITHVSFGEGTDPLAAAERLGLMFSKSGMFGVANPSQGEVLALTCILERKTPTQLLRTHHMIEGKLAMRADAMQAEFQARGGRVKWLRSDTEACEATFSSAHADPVTVKVTLKELMDAGVAVSGKTGQVKDNYRKHPRQMLRARVISEGVRMVDPAVVTGQYTPEEIGDGTLPEDAGEATLKNAAVLPAIEVAERLAPQILPAPVTQAVVASPAPALPAPAGEVIDLTMPAPVPEAEVKEQPKKPARDVSFNEVSGCLSEYGTLQKKNIEQVRAGFIDPLGIKTIRESSQKQRLDVLSRLWAAYPGDARGPRLTALVAELKKGGAQ